MHRGRKPIGRPRETVTHLIQNCLPRVFIREDNRSEPTVVRNRTDVWSADSRSINIAMIGRYENIKAMVNEQMN